MNVSLLAFQPRLESSIEEKFHLFMEANDRKRDNELKSEEERRRQKENQQEMERNREVELQREKEIKKQRRVLITYQISSFAWLT